MKKILCLFTIVFMLVSCSNLFDKDDDDDGKTNTENTTGTETGTDTKDSGGTDTSGTTESGGTEKETGAYILTENGKRYVYNSDWNLQTLSNLSPTAKAAEKQNLLFLFMETAYAETVDITEADLQAAVDALNKSSAETQYFIESTETPVTESPTCTAYIVDETPVDGAYPVIKQWDNWDRTDLCNRREAWRMEAANLGGILYIDHIPDPPEPVIDPRSDYEKTAVYIICTDDAGIQSIYMEEHCSETYSAYQQSRFDTLEKWYQHRLEAYKSEVSVLGTAHYSCVYGSLYHIVDGKAVKYTEYVAPESE
jgi:hypothetical protein